MSARRMGLKAKKDENFLNKYKMLLKVTDDKVNVSLHNNMKNDAFIDPKLIKCGNEIKTNIHGREIIFDKKYKPLHKCR